MSKASMSALKAPKTAILTRRSESTLEDKAKSSDNDRGGM